MYKTISKQKSKTAPKSLLEGENENHENRSRITHHLSPTNPKNLPMSSSEISEHKTMKQNRLKCYVLIQNNRHSEFSDTRFRSSEKGSDVTKYC